MVISPVNGIETIRGEGFSVPDIIPHPMPQVSHKPIHTDISSGAQVFTPEKVSGVTQVGNLSSYMTESVGPGNPTHVGLLPNGEGGAYFEQPKSLFVSGNYAYIVGYGSDSLEIVDISVPFYPVWKGSITNGTDGAKLRRPTCVFVSGNYAYIGAEWSESLEIVDVTDPVHPKHKGSITHGEDGANLLYPKSIFVSGDYAYIAKGIQGGGSTINNGVEIINIADPENPVHVSYIGDNGLAPRLHNPFSITIKDNYAYVFTEGGLTILDISNPASPAYVGRCLIWTLGDGPLSRSVKSGYVSGNYAYIVTDSTDPPGRLEIVDISNPAAPDKRTEIALSTSACPFYGLSVYVVGNYAYVIDYDGNSLEIFNVSDPDNPSSAGIITNGEGYAKLSGPLGLFVQNNHAYIVGHKYLEVVDVSNPAAPAHKGTVIRGDGVAKLHEPRKVFVVDDTAYVATNNDALEIVNISDPSNPIHKSSIVNGVSGAKLDNPLDVYVSGNYAYVAALDSNALEIIDISNPSTPFHCGSIVDGTGGAILSGPTKVHVAGNYAYVISLYGGSLEIVDVSNKTNPTHVGFLQDIWEPHSITVSGNYAYIGRRQGIQVVDISNPSNPVTTCILQNQAGGAELDYPNDIKIYGNHAYVAAGGNALEIVNISNPTNPVHAGKIKWEGDAYLPQPKGVALNWPYAYVVGGGGGQSSLEIVDVSDPANPVHHGYVKYDDGNGVMLQYPTSVDVSGNYAYVTNRDGSSLEVLIFEPLIPSITSITPSSGVNTNSVNVTITGTNFLQTTNTVNLTKTGQSNISATNVAWVSPTQITCTLPITGAAAGYWNVALKIGGQMVTRKNGFSVTNPPRDAMIVSNNFPTSMTSGQKATVSVRVKNTGANTWKPGTNYKLGGLGDANKFGPVRVNLPAGASIGPGKEHTFTFSVTAPTSGTYTPKYRMLQEGVGWFGQTSSKKVTVRSLGSTSGVTSGDTSGRPNSVFASPTVQVPDAATPHVLNSVRGGPVVLPSIKGITSGEKSLAAREGVRMVERTVL